MEETYVIVAFDNEELEIYQHENPGETVGAQYAPYWRKKVVAWAFAPFGFPFHMQKKTRR
jgi:hypothetical protein